MKEGIKKKLAVLASGRGSNFVAIHDAIERGDINAEIDILITNKPSAGVIDIAKKRNIEVRVMESKGLVAGEFDRKAVELLTERGIELIILAGFMRIIGMPLIEAFPLRIMNIHPSLLPAFKGLDAQKQALEYGAKIAGCSVHFVDEGVDTGPIILQRAVPVAANDTVETLSERILAEEHLIYPEAVKLFVEDRLQIDGRTVLIDGK
ncbi:MAG: phosphoribosylglycinamide formyltransferase [bacterium]|nr:phosphoribosylglycinamide formyltransferase [bacterium]